MKVPFLNRLFMLHLLFCEMETDSSAASELSTDRISSLSLVIVLIISFSKQIPMPSSVSFLTASRQSVVFLAKRLMDLVITRSIRFASQSAISRRNSLRLSFLVPLIPSSA